MIQRSPLLEIMARQLRNDSFDDMAKQFELYLALIKLMSVMTQVPHLLFLLSGDRMVYSVGSSVLALCFSVPDKQQNCTLELTKPITMFVSRLHSSAQRMQELRQRAHIATSEFEHTVEGRHVLNFCAQFIILHDSMKANTAINGALSRGKGKERAVEEVATGTDNMVQWHRDTCVDAVEDDVIQAGFYYSKELAKPVEPVSHKKFLSH